MNVTDVSAAVFAGMSKLDAKAISADDAYFAQLPSMTGAERDRALEKAKGCFAQMMKYNAVPVGTPEAESLILNVQACLHSCKDQPFVSRPNGMFAFENGLAVNYKTYDFWGVFCDRMTSTLTATGRAVLEYLDEAYGAVDVRPGAGGLYDFIRLPKRESLITPFEAEPDETLIRKGGQYYQEMLKADGLEPGSEAAMARTRAVQACLAGCREKPFQCDRDNMIVFDNGLRVNYRSWDDWGPYVNRETSMLNAKGRLMLAYMEQTFGTIEMTKTATGTFSFKHATKPVERPAGGTGGAGDKPEPV